MNEQSPIVFTMLPAATMDVLQAMAVHHGCHELSVPQLMGKDTRAVLGPLCKEVTWLDDEARGRLLSHGIRDSTAYIMCVMNEDSLRKTWFVAAVVHQRNGYDMTKLTLRVQFSPLEDIMPMMLAVSKTIPVSQSLSATAEAIVDRESCPPRPIY